MATFIEFSDRPVPYEVFLNDVAARVVHMLRSTTSDPEYITQNKAFKIFGRTNVERWRSSGKVECFKTPGKVLFRTADLRIAQTGTDRIYPNTY